MDVQALLKAGMLPSESALRLLTRSVNTAYRDAHKLVGRIRDRRQDTEQALPEEATCDLLDSLQLSPVRDRDMVLPRLTSIRDNPRGTVPILTPKMGRGLCGWRPASKRAGMLELINL